MASGSGTNPAVLEVGLPEAVSPMISPAVVVQSVPSVPVARPIKEASSVADGTIQPPAGDVPHPVVTLEQVQSSLEVALIGIREVALNGGHSGLTPSDRLQGYSF